MAQVQLHIARVRRRLALPRNHGDSITLSNIEVSYQVTSHPMTNDLSQNPSYLFFNSSMYADGRLTPGLEIMDLFGGPVLGIDFFPTSE